MGVFVFDGLKWKNYNNKNSLISDNHVKTIYVDEDNKKWIGSGEDLITNIGSAWASYNAAFAKFSTGRINSIQVEKNGTIWLLTDDGVSKYEGTSWKIYDSKNSILPQYLSSSNIIIDKNDYKWIASSNFGLFKFDDKEWTVYNRTNSGLRDNSISAFFISQNDTKWIGTRFEQLVKFDGTKWNNYRIYNSGLYDIDITAIAQDKLNNIWVSLKRFGLAKFNGKDWNCYTNSNSEIEPHPFMYEFYLAVDSNEVLWSGTYGEGLEKFDGKILTKFNSINSPFTTKLIKEIKIDKYNNKWVLAEDGLFKYDDKDWSNPDNLNGTPILDYYGDIWLEGYINYLYKYDGNHWKQYYQYKNNSIPNSYAVDKKGVLWIGTMDGLVRCDGTNSTLYDSTFTKFSANDVYKIAIDANDVIWMISWEGELSKFDGTNWKFIKKYFGIGDARNVTSLFIDNKGNKWLGTVGGGIFIYREGGVNLTSVEETPEIASQSVLIYPNPVSDILTISGEWNNCSQYIITDYLGYEIKKGNLASNVIAVSSLTKGMYFITIRDGVTSKTLKFMKM